jgi:maleylpyruvate isomerase
MGPPTVEIEGISVAHRVLVENLQSLSDDQARLPSLLPDWTVGHVLTHLARNADSVVRRLEGAARGEIVDQYPGGYVGRAADIAVGAGRPADELVDDVTQTAVRLDAALAAMPTGAWGNLTRDVSGAERPAHTLPLSRWREVEVHHADLGLGYSPADWSGEMVHRCLTRELDRLAVRCDPATLLAWVTGRSQAPTLGPW